MIDVAGALGIKGEASFVGSQTVAKRGAGGGNRVEPL